MAPAICFDSHFSAEQHCPTSLSLEFIKWAETDQQSPLLVQATRVKAACAWPGVASARLEPGSHHPL